MLEIRKGTAAKSYENTFFREFAGNLQKMFSKYSLDGLLIGNSVCEAEERLQIDALLITKRVVCIIDFKNCGGKVYLPDSFNFSTGKWTNSNGELIMGGSAINPHLQLKIQKERFVKICQEKIVPKLADKDCFNPFHTVRIVCFQKAIDLQGTVPSKEELNFFIIDKANYLEKIRDIIDIENQETLITEKSFSAFQDVFKADIFDTREIYDEPYVFKGSSNLNYEELYPDQKAALKQIEEFIKSDNESVFILHGSSLCGKTYLVPYIQDIAYNNDIPQIELFASSSRVANNLLANSNMEFKSIYSYIYGGGLQVENEIQEVDSEDIMEENDEKINLEIVPIKRCDNEESSIFIVDEGQLVTDNYYQSLDLRFGSGKILEDFIKFTDFKNSKRKVIFIGDSYQLIIGNKEECALNPLYLKEHYKLPVLTFHLIDKPDKSIIAEQALSLASSINQKLYNNLVFSFSENFNTIERTEIQQLIQNLNSSNSEVHLLCYSNSEAQKINFWIKKSIIQNGEDLVEGDLIIFNNNIRVEDADDPFAEPKKVYNGQFGNIQNVSTEVFTEVVTPNRRQPITLKFREVIITLKDTGYNVNVLCSENYRLSEKGEYSEDEIIGLKILLNREISSHLKTKPFEKSDSYKELINSKDYIILEGDIKSLRERLNSGEKVKGKLEESEKLLRKLTNSVKKKHRNLIIRELSSETSSKFYKYRNAAQIRFGWALTVHKAMSFKWDEIILNSDQGENRGKANEDYFRWIYTGITRAKQKVHLINYLPINPFSRIEFKEKSPLDEPNKGIYLQIDSSTILDDSGRDMIAKYNLPEGQHTTILIQLFQFIQGKIAGSNIEVVSITHHNNQEIYEFKSIDDKTTRISFYYRNNGQVKKPTVLTNNSELSERLLSLLLSNNQIEEFSFIKDNWREKCYHEIKSRLIQENVFFAYIIQTLYKDTICFSRETSELLVDFNYDGNGFFSSIIAQHYDDKTLWMILQELMNKLKVGD